MEDAILKWRSLYYYSFRNELIRFTIVANTTSQVFLFSFGPSISATLLQQHHPSRSFSFFES